MLIRDKYLMNRVEYIENLDFRIKRLIGACLEKDPEKRIRLTDIMVALFYYKPSIFCILER